MRTDIKQQQLPCVFLFLFSPSLFLSPSSWSPKQEDAHNAPEETESNSKLSHLVCVFISLSCSGGGPQAGEPGQGRGRAARPDGHPAPEAGGAEGSHG